MKKQNSPESRNNSIQIKASYIGVMLAVRLYYSGLTLFLSFFLFLFSFQFLAISFSSNFLANLVLPMAIILAILVMLPLLFSGRILKRQCNKWDYSRFHTVERFAKILSILSMSCIGAFSLIGLSDFYYLLPIWSPFLTLGLVVLLIYALIFSSVFSLVGRGVLSFKLFLKEFEKKSDYADFGKLFRGAKRISKIARRYNMRVSPYDLTLGLNISFLDDKKGTRKDFNDLTEWIENPTNKENFDKFRKLIKKFSMIAEKSAKMGIKERSHWSFERMATFFEAIATPVIVAVFVYVVPKILEMLD